MRRYRVAQLVVALTALTYAMAEETSYVSGYVVGSYRRTDDANERVARTEVDAIKLLGSTTLDPVTLTASLWHQPRAPQSVALLDAYATWNVGGGSKLTAGKFLTYFGYESFDLSELAQLSYANGDFLAPIPGYHSGVKYDYAGAQTEFGVALVDSVYSGPYYLRGDGEIRHNVGVETMVKHTVGPWKIFAGLGLDTRGNVISRNDEILVANLWASYTVRQATFAAEWTHKSGVEGDEGFNWLLACTHPLGGRWTTTWRVSGEQVHHGVSLLKYTVSPGYKVHPRVTLRAEYSRYGYRHHPAEVRHADFFGAQVVFLFGRLAP